MKIYIIVLTDLHISIFSLLEINIVLLGKSSILGLAEKDGPVFLPKQYYYWNVHGNNWHNKGRVKDSSTGGMPWTGNILHLSIKQCSITARIVAVIP